MTERRDDDNNNSISLLRRWTVIVLLSLLVFVTVGNFIDDLFFDNQFTTDPAFFYLTGGMITGLFSSEAIKIWRSGGPNQGGKN